MKGAIVAAALAMTASFATVANAGEAEQCAAAYEHGQELRLDRHLRAAREQFLVCANASCPKVARDDCSRWLGEVDAALPSIIVGAQRASEPFSEARVMVDGDVVAERLDGHPIPLDPGAHTVRVEPRGCSAHQATITLRAGQAPARVDFTVCAEVATLAKPPASIPAATFVLGGIALAALGTFVGFGSVGLADTNQLRATCYPHCAQGPVDGANAELLVADISLGVAVVSLVVAGVAWLVGRHSATSARAHAALVWSPPAEWAF